MGRHLKHPNIILDECKRMPGNAQTDVARRLRKECPEADRSVAFVKAAEFHQESLNDDVRVKVPISGGPLI